MDKKKLKKKYILTYELICDDCICHSDKHASDQADPTKRRTMMLANIFNR